MASDAQQLGNDWSALWELANGNCVTRLVECFARPITRDQIAYLCAAQGSVKVV